MKKILFIMICLFATMPIIKADTWFGTSEKITEMNITFKEGDKVYSNSPFLFRMQDGKIVYCVKPFTEISHEIPYKEYVYNNSIFNISDEQLERIKLIAYYGYNYPGHEDRIWYGITQFLIWKTFDLDDIYFTNERYGDKINIYQDKINEIEYLINTHNIQPSFINNTFEYKGNNEYVEEDNNNVLNKYLISSSNISSSILDNKLYINTKEDGNYYIEFMRKRELNNNYILYGVNDYQTLFYPGGIENISFRLNIEVNSGTIIVNKIDSENRKDALLSNAIYSVEKDGNKVGEITTDDNGIGSISNLELGNYLVKEIKPSIGYLLDNNTYYVNLTKDNKEIIIKSYEDIIKSNILITKYYGENDNYELENDATFELYDSKDELVKTYTTENGSISDTIPYGNYYLKQIKGIEGYSLIDKYDFNIETSNDYNINLYNDPIKFNITITKYYGDDNNYIKEDGAVFDLYDSNNNFIKEYIINGEIKDTLNYGEYYLKQTKGIEGYYLIDKYDLKLKNNQIKNIALYNKKIEEPIIVNVPNTGVKSYKHLSLFTIILGIIIVILSKKTT